MVTRKTWPQFIIRVLIVYKVLVRQKAFHKLNKPKQPDLIGPSCCSRDLGNHHHQRSTKISSWRADDNSLSHNSVFKAAAQLYAKIN